MPKVIAKVLASKVDNGQLLAKLQFNERLPKVGDKVTVKWGSVRSTPQNSLYWAFLNWCVKDAGLNRDHGYSALGLHESLKSHFLSEKRFTKGQFEEMSEATTTNLTKSEFGEYFEAVKYFIQDFFGINTSEFEGDERTESKDEIF